MRLIDNFKKLPNKKKIFISYIFVLFIIQMLLLIYVYCSLNLYEKYQIENYMEQYLDGLVSDLKKGILGNRTIIEKVVSPYEDNPYAIINGYKEIVENNEVVYKNVRENTYDIYAGDTKIFTIVLDDSDVTNRLSLLSINKWKIKDVINYSKDGLYDIEIFTTSDYEIYINDMPVVASDVIEKKSIEGFEDAYLIGSYPTMNHYLIKGLCKKPTIKAYNRNHKEVKAEIKDNIYYFINKTELSNEDANKKIKKINPLEISKMWSLFLSNDVSLNSMKEYLIPNSSLYNKAVTWANGIDHTFTASHILDNPIFNEEYIDNYVFYGDKMFSVDVKFNKNLILTTTGEKRVISIKDRLYFVLYSGSYKLINIVSM